MQLEKKMIIKMLMFHNISNKTFRKETPITTEKSDKQLLDLRSVLFWNKILRKDFIDFNR